MITALPLGALSAHQVEEYILSPMLLGEKYHFLEWAYRSGVYISPMEVATVNTIPYLLTPLLPSPLHLDSNQAGGRRHGGATPPR